MRLETIDTPAVLIDETIVDRNIARVQARVGALGRKLRPHVKTHKIPEIAHRQMAAGAAGINCQKLAEAEIMAAAGLGDILITYNILGPAKLNRLRRLADSAEIAVVADSETVLAGLSDTFATAAAPLRVLVECDTGAGRCGVQSPAAAQALAARVEALPGLRLGGLMTYPPIPDQRAVNAWLAEARERMEATGLACAEISVGGSPNLGRLEHLAVATEHRPGTYIYNDRAQIAAGVATVADCALKVRATVVSAPTADRIIVDAGSKVLTTDPFGLDGHGLIPALGDVVVTALSEEHGIIRAPGVAGKTAIGARLDIIPNHACVVANMLDQVHLAAPTGEVRPVRVAARGAVC